MIGRFGVLGSIGAGNTSSGFAPGAVTDLRFDVGAYLAGSRRYNSFGDIPGATLGVTQIVAGQGLVNTGSNFPVMTDLAALGMSGVASSGVTLVAEVTLDDAQTPAFPWVFALSGGGPSNRHGVYWNRSTERFSALARISGAGASVNDTVNTPDGARYTVGAVFDVSGAVRVGVGGRVSSASRTVDLSLQDRLELTYGDGALEGTLHRLTVYAQGASAGRLGDLTG